MEVQTVVRVAAESARQEAHREPRLDVVRAGVLRRLGGWWIARVAASGAWRGAR